MCIKTGMNARKESKSLRYGGVHLADMLQMNARPQRQTKETEQADSTFSEQVEHLEFDTLCCCPAQRSNN